MQLRQTIGKNIADRVFDVAFISLGATAIAVATVIVASTVVGEKIYRRVMRVVDEEFRLMDDVSLAEKEFAVKWDRGSHEAEIYRDRLKKARDYFYSNKDYNSANELVVRLNGIHPF